MTYHKVFERNVLGCQSRDQNREGQHILQEAKSVNNRSKGTSFLAHPLLHMRDRIIAKTHVAVDFEPQREFGAIVSPVLVVSPLHLFPFQMFLSPGLLVCFWIIVKMFI